MAFALVVATLAAALAGTGVFLIQTLFARKNAIDIVHRQAITEFARKRGGTLTPSMVAEHLGIPIYEADRLLRSMVDDRFLRMAVDEHSAEVVFWFTKLTAGPNLIENSSEYIQVRRSESTSFMKG